MITFFPFSYHFCHWIVLLFASIQPFPVAANAPFASTEDLPIAYQGRFRSLDSAAKLWLYDTYHKDRIKLTDRPAFHSSDGSALELLWKFHFLSHTPYDDAPLFWMHYAEVKSLLNLNLHEDRFSFNQLFHAINNEPISNLKLMRYLLPYEFARNYLGPTNRSHSDKSELTSLSSGLWLALQKNALVVIKTPSIPPWHLLKPGFILEPEARNELSIIEKKRKIASTEILKLFQTLQIYVQELDPVKSNDQLQVTLTELEKNKMDPQEIYQTLENRTPLIHRLQNAGSTLKLLPSRQLQGEWFSLHALKIKVYDPKQKQLILSDNFTSFTDHDFYNLRTAYLNLESAVRDYTLTPNAETSNSLQLAVKTFADAYLVAYASLVSTPSKHAGAKQLLYPSLWQLKAESYYHKLPLIEIALMAYLCALVLFLIAYSLKKTSIERWALACLLIGFLLHTAVLALRCYVLARPPVSNMFETVIYVPWIAMALGLIFYFTSHSRLVLCASCFTSLALLILLKLTHIDSRMENVQAVLDSQYWLIVHVLMVVGSYGAFAVCGILGHAYILSLFRSNIHSHVIAKGILHTMYVGVALLIPGTILGGIWAAESWGRFWDWDPKESWAFISACVYLLVIHAYTFNRIRDFGLAIGSIGGLMAISFTWYGVNYILGTGLHSYGFGSGGEGIYFLYLFAESIFILIATLFIQRKKLLEKK